MNAMLIRGSDLGPKLRAEVLAAFIYRWTSDNPRRQEVWGKLTGKPTMPLVTDDVWLANHAFYITKQGRLALRPRRCEPVYMVNERINGVTP